MFLCRRSMMTSTSASEELDRVRTTGTTHTLEEGPEKDSDWQSIKRFSSDRDQELGRVLATAAAAGSGGSKRFCMVLGGSASPAPLSNLRPPPSSPPRLHLVSPVLDEGVHVGLWVVQGGLDEL